MCKKLLDTELQITKPPLPPPPRRKWPFNTMKVGKGWLKIEIKGEWRTAAKSAHAFASKKGWKMETYWDKARDIGVIRRVK